ncbi:MAG: ATP-dependent DNA helicase [Anaerolineae bacterium]
MAHPVYLPPTLTPAQLAAILHQGSPLLIIAGPGSGKTEVITWRVAHLVRAGLAPPEKLLVTTFTERAALELKDRIQQKLPQVNVELMQVSTIHSFCADLLRRYRQHSPLPRGFRILDGTGQLLFVFTNRKVLGLGGLVKSRQHDFFSSVVRLFNLATEELVEAERLEAWCRDNLSTCSENDSNLWRERAVVAEAYGRYCDLLLEQELVDFAFLQRHALTMLEQHPSLVEALRQQYQAILVDEYQDTNAAQDRLLQLLSGDGHHLTVVGDDDQSIYRFRGATVKNIRTFAERFPGTTVITLGENFRSRKPIVDHSLQVIAHNPARFGKQLSAVRHEHTDIVLVYERTAQEEAQAVVELLRRFHNTGQIPRYGDVAILLRSVRSHAGPYLEVLRAAGIPCHVVGDASFFERDEIAQLYDLLNFLSASRPWGDRYVRHPLMGFGETTRAALEACQKDLMGLATDEALQEIGVSDAEDRRRLLALLHLKRRVQTGEHRSLLAVFYDLLAATGCVARFERAGNVDALLNLGALSRLVAGWDEHGSTRNFYPFQEYLKLLREGGVDPVTAPPEDAVQVMTIHQAKGLEFPVVVVGSVMEGRLPLTHRRDRYDIPYDLRVSGEPEVENPHLVDERKLFYVAVTRARDLLIVGTADVVAKRGGGPSRFVHEMFGEDLKAAARDTQAAAESQAQAHGPRERHSFSRLAYFLQCPMRYKLAVFYDFQPPWLDPVDFGANVHRALEAIHQLVLAGQAPTDGEVAGIVESTWVSPRRAEPELEEKFREAAVAQLRRYLDEHQESLARVLLPETAFSFSLQERVLVGKIDLLRRWGAEGGVEVVDFKTGESSADQSSEIDLQMDLYALGAETGLGQRVARQTVHFLGDNAVRTWAWSARREETALERLSGVLERIERSDFPPQTSYCLRCDEFRAICPHAARKD